MRERKGEGVAEGSFVQALLALVLLESTEKVKYVDFLLLPVSKNRPSQITRRFLAQ